MFIDERKHLNICILKLDICVYIKMKFRTSLPTKNKCFIHEQTQSGSSRYIFDFEIWKLDSSRGYKITFYEAWHHRIVSKVPALWRSHMLNSSPGRWRQICASKLISARSPGPDKQLSDAAPSSSFKPSLGRWLAENIRFPTTLKVTLGTSTQQFVEKKRWNKSFHGGLPGGWRPGEVVTRPNCRGPLMARSCRRCAAMARARRGARRGLLTRSWLLLSSLHPWQRTLELSNCNIDEHCYQCRQVSSSRFPLQIFWILM